MCLTQLVHSAGSISIWITLACGAKVFSCRSPGHQNVHPRRSASRTPAREVRRFGAVHSQHSQIVRIIAATAPSPFSVQVAGIFVVEKILVKQELPAPYPRHHQRTARFLRFCQHLARLLDFGMGESTSFSTVVNHGSRSPLANWIFLGYRPEPDQDDLSWQRRMLSHDARQLFQRLHQEAVLSTGNDNPRTSTS